MAILDAIREVWIALITEDENFLESIEQSTSSLKNKIYRFNAWQKVINEVLSSTLTKPRRFTRVLKLFNTNPACKIYNTIANC